MTERKQPIDTREMRSNRAALLDQARALLDKSSPSATDRETARQKIEEARSLALEIDRAELGNDQLRDEAARQFGHSYGTGPVFRNVETGEEVRSIRHGESFTRSLGLQRPSMSLGKLIVGAATGDWRHAEEERAAYSQGASVNGGYLLTPEMSSMVIDLARGQSVVSQLGVTTLPMATEILEIAKVDSDPTAYWTGENQEITESNGTFGLCRLRAKCLAIYCTASLELVRNAANAQSIIEDTIAKALAAKLDSSFINGTGASNEPQGLLNSPNVGTYGVDGPISHDKLVLAAAQLWGGNVEPDAMLMDSTLRSEIARLKDGEGRYQPPPVEVSKLRPYMASTISSTDSNHAMYIGMFQNCILGMRNQVEIEVSATAGDVFKKKQIAIRGLVWADFLVCRSGDVVRLKGITEST